ncbi:hypothetical protein DNU06_03095 [Putridiphycobacter roseus]|uniref:TonB-dependent receptor plug domain-containing protein n=1 Tax=Putridiphycobacter roseus TaxID=2219161 RepID=A0A2W1NT53_9FLAO|nr:TonB-dependent receptor plug domain-containing protein [Putridiphycobacter roseus]PZE18832.1 hypothetical protein DNU06_03095 [Putridiphycobacter roseus]
MKKFRIVILSFLFGVAPVFAQQGTGTIMGYVYGSDSITAVPFASVWIDFNGDVIGVKSDYNGKYKLSAIQPGVYNLHSSAIMEGKTQASGVNVYAESIAKHDLYLPGNDTLATVIVSGDPLIKLEHIETIPLSDIQNSPNIQDPKRMLSNRSSEVKVSPNGELIIRGSRPGDVVYFVDGVKQTNMQSVPGVSINSMSVYTGGIPAKYGDTTGGVVILNTKSYFDLYYAWKASQN